MIFETLVIAKTEELGHDMKFIGQLADTNLTSSTGFFFEIIGLKLHGDSVVTSSTNPQMKR